MARDREGKNECLLRAIQCKRLLLECLVLVAIYRRPLKLSTGITLHAKKMELDGKAANLAAGQTASAVTSTTAKFWCAEGVVQSWAPLAEGESSASTTSGTTVGRPASTVG